MLLYASAAEAGFCFLQVHVSLPKKYVPTKVSIILVKSEKSSLFVKMNAGRGYVRA